QKNPILEREYCEIIGSYILPLSVYAFNDNDKVDEVFRRINSNGKHLSKQELRSAGATSKFANLVRIISSEIRSDASASDIILLNEMKKISITNKELEYGIKVDDIFWVKNKILTKEMLRESRDEQIVADIIAYMLLPETPRSSASISDEYYGFKNGKNQEKIETSLVLKQPEHIKKEFIIIYNHIREILQESKRNFSELISLNNLKYMPRPFQVIFFSFYDLVFREKMEIANYDGLVKSLKNINKDIDITSGQTWSYQNKRRNINKVKGIIREFFKIRDNNDPAKDSWLTEFETLLTQSKTEQSLYDFKQGFTQLDGRGQFDQGNFSKIILTLTAMANHSPGATGYVCVGVADNDQTAQRIKKLYNIEPVEYKNFKITGIEHEAKRLQGNIDNFYLWITQQIKSEPIPQTVKDTIGREIKIIDYHDKSVLIFCLKAGEKPIQYDGKFYQRIGANIEEIDIDEYAELFKRFSK
ncbi:RNA-binding domain-containing protein, partial [Anabaena sp. UHCC 0253]